MAGAFFIIIADVTVLVGSAFSVDFMVELIFVVSNKVGRN
jgi:hypothetical protein